MTPRQVVGPLILIGLGTLFPVNNLVADISIFRLFRHLWPVVLIVIGAANLAGVITGSAVRRWGHFSGGIIMITLGMLFLIQEFGIVNFSRTWPALLIVIGGLGLLRVTLGPVYFADRFGRPFKGGYPR